MDILKPSIDEENKIDDIANSLYRRIISETEKILKTQLALLGVHINEQNTIDDVCDKVYHTEDVFTLATYYYKDLPILTSKISRNKMAIEFNIYKVEAQEVQE
jgi:hypothetical protein